MATYAIGDVQGCYQELNTLLNVIKFDPTHDKLWFCGDLVNRGPNSLATLRFVRSLKDRAVVVLGNHDLHLLALANGQATEKKNDSLQEVLNAPDCQELCDWLRHRPLLHYDANYDYALVHAGIPPQWSLQNALAYAREVETILQSCLQQEFYAHLYGNIPNRWDDNLLGWPRLRIIVNYLTRMRFCDEQGTLDLTAKGKPEEPPPDFFPWYKIPSKHHAGLKIIFGHWAALNGETNEPNLHALDTGCSWGKSLTAFRLEDERRFSVPCPNPKGVKS